MSQSSEGVSLEMSQCAKLGQRGIQDSGLKCLVTAASAQRNFDDPGLTFAVSLYSSSFHFEPISSLCPDCTDCRLLRIKTTIVSANSRQM